MNIIYVNKIVFRKMEENRYAMNGNIILFYIIFYKFKYRIIFFKKNKY